MSRVSSSFRDPSGRVFTSKGVLYRSVNPCYATAYRQLMSSGLYQELVGRRLLICHSEVEPGLLKPEVIDLISYPYEWSFSMLKDAALVTLEVQRTALKYGMVLKDASAYNIQFQNGKPILIDTLSFEGYVVGQPWYAYGQFCQHFLAPLALMCKRDVRLGQVLRSYLDGIPLDLASSLLPSSINLGLWLHLKLHSFSRNHSNNGKSRKIGLSSLKGLNQSLEGVIRSLKCRSKGTWEMYYREGSYSCRALDSKKEIVGRFLDKVKPEVVWDFGANTGVFSRLAADRGSRVVAFDSDPVCTELNYLDTSSDVLPLTIDLTNPSPGIGWGNRERLTIWDRGRPNTVFALALIHHLAIGNNLPLDWISEFFSKLCETLVTEFIPKEDPKVRKMLSTRLDIFPNYTRESFEIEFSKYFALVEVEGILDSGRILYRMENKGRLVLPVQLEEAIERE